MWIEYGLVNYGELWKYATPPPDKGIHSCWCNKLTDLSTSSLGRRLYSIYCVRSTDTVLKCAFCWGVSANNATSNWERMYIAKASIGHEFSTETHTHHEHMIVCVFEVSKNDWRKHYCVSQNIIKLVCNCRQNVYVFPQRLRQYSVQFAFELAW